MSTYKKAINLTMDTIGSRARSYRNLVVAVVITVFCSIAWAIATWSVSPISGLIMLVPVCSLFFHIDGRILNRWRSALLADWTKGEIELRYFRGAVNANPILPKGTMQGMMETLPAAGETITDEKMSSATREAVSAFVTFIHACRTDAIAIRTVTYASAGALLVAAATMWDWRPLLGIISFALIHPLQKFAKSRRVASAKEIVDSSKENSEFDREKYLEAISQFQEDPFAKDLLNGKQI